MRHASYYPARSAIAPDTGPEGMFHEAGFFGAHDGLTLFEQTWGPRTSPRARVMLLHDFYEHGSRYSELAYRLASRGVAVHAYDLRGHGHSEGVRGDFRLDDHLGDVSTFVRRVVRPRANEPRTPTVILGRGIGSILGCLHAVATNEPGALAGVVSLALKTKAPRAISVTARVASVFRRDVCAYEMRALAGSPQSADPLVWDAGLTRGAASEVALGWTRLKHQALALRVPLLVLEAGADSFVDPRELNAWYHRVSSGDKTMRIYPGRAEDWRREQPVREQVISDVVEWLEPRV